MNPLIKTDDRPVIAQIVHTLTVGGAEMLAARLARALADRYRFLFVCLDAHGPLADALRHDGFPVIALQRRPGFDGRCAWHLSRLLARSQVALVHAHQYGPFFYSAVARLLGRRRPILFTEHGRGYPDFRRPKRVLANRLLLRRCDRVVGVGRAVADALRAFEGLPEERIGVVFNGIDVDTFAPADGLREHVRAELGLSSDEFTIVQVARLDPLKDHATAIRAMRLLAARHPKARLLIAGVGPQKWPLRRQVSEAGLGEIVRFLGLRDDVPRLLAAADAALLTSVSEGVPLTLMEAMAAGVPVVATRVGGVPEVVQDGVTGLLAPAGDAEGIAARISRLIADPASRWRLSEASQSRARALFSARRMHGEYDRLYREQLGGLHTAPSPCGNESRNPAASRTGCSIPDKLRNGFTVGS